MFSILACENVNNCMYQLSCILINMFSTANDLPVCQKKKNQLGVCSLQQTTTPYTGWSQPTPPSPILWCVKSMLRITAAGNTFRFDIPATRSNSPCQHLILFLPRGTGAWPDIPTARICLVMFPVCLLSISIITRQPVVWSLTPGVAGWNYVWAVYLHIPGWLPKRSSCTGNTNPTNAGTVDMRCLWSLCKAPLIYNFHM